MLEKNNWNRDVDVLVVGYGLAGAIAAIAAKDAGREVLIVEKQKVAGGNSILSGGSVLSSADKLTTFHYLDALSGGRVDKDVIDFMAKGLFEVSKYFSQLVGSVDARMERTYNPWIGYPFPGRESFWHLDVKDLPDKATEFNTHGEGGGGRRLMEVAFRNVNNRGIEAMLSTPVKKLIQDSRGAIVGAVVEHEGKAIALRTKRGIILACGGFEFNDWLKKQYVEIQPIYGVGSTGNTGDGILMAQKTGAALWHMWLLHGGYGFKFPEFQQAFRISIGGYLNPEKPRRLPWILVNHAGKRFMNEALPYAQDSAYRYMQSMDTDYYNTPSGFPEYPHIPSYMILDEAGRATGPIAKPLWLMEEHAYQWSNDNQAEIDKGWIKRASTLEELATSMKVDSVQLVQTVRNWNKFCRAGKDDDYHRIAGSMVPIENPPFYCLECWPVVTNTQGGPRFNARCQIVDPYNEPIPGLYKAGELGSFFGHLYHGAGNLAECIIEGRTAGEHAASEIPR